MTLLIAFIAAPFCLQCAGVLHPGRQLRERSSDAGHLFLLPADDLTLFVDDTPLDAIHGSSFPDRRSARRTA
jgi:hypothetical protein